MAGAERIAVRQIQATESMKEGELWYPVSLKWWQKWTEYTQFNAGAADAKLADADASSKRPEGKQNQELSRQMSMDGDRPGPIDNSSLKGASDEELLKGLSAGSDYHLVSAATWEKLMAWYGGGPAFPRMVVPFGARRELRVELYPLVFEVTQANLEGPSDGQSEGPAEVEQQRRTHL